MAALLGMPLVNVTRYVRGPVVPPHDFLSAVADRYNVSLDWLYGRSERGGVKDAEEAEPAWARRLDARLRYLERQLADATSEPGQPEWARSLSRQVLRNEGMLLAIERRLGITDEEWDEATEQILRRSGREAIEAVLGPLPSADVAAEDASDSAPDTHTSGGREPVRPHRRRSAK